MRAAKSKMPPNKMPEDFRVSEVWGRPDLRGCYKSGGDRRMILTV
jgi:hypothetical protein